MIYIVRWYRDDEIVAEQRCEDLHEAKQVARDRLPAHKSRNGATSALVCDDSGTVYLRIF